MTKNTKSKVRQVSKLSLWLNAFAALIFLVGIALVEKPASSKASIAADPAPMVAPADSSLGPGTYSTLLAGTPVYLYLPQNILTQTNNTRPIQVIVALHGINSSGQSFGANLADFARQNQLIIVAPTFNYNLNWQDPQVIAAEDSRLAGQLNSIVNDLKKRIQPAQPDNRLLIYGFSRGAQLAHRFALLYPENTLGVAVQSAGSYTLPFTTSPDQSNVNVLPFPFGVSNLGIYWTGGFNNISFRKIMFLVEVGAMDTNPTQTPTAWDAYLGKGRVERATEFNHWLTVDGVNSRLIVVPGTGHTVNAATRAPVLQFFSGLLTQPALHC